jgi:hypothetical protein
MEVAISDLIPTHPSDGGGYEGGDDFLEGDDDFLGVGEHGSCQHPDF